MRSEPRVRRSGRRSTEGSGTLLMAAMYAFVLSACSAATAGGGTESPAAASAAPAVDPRVGLAPGITDAGEAASNMELLISLPRPEAFSTNSDIAFGGDFLFLGNYNGYNIYDISNPERPDLRVSVLCPGNQGDISVHGTLLFHSVQATSGRLDCGTEGVTGQVSPERFLGVRIFDISNVENPVQVAAVQTCRGSHTHSLVTDPSDPEHVYVYVSGTSGVRPGDELPGCSGLMPEEDPNTSLFRIEVIQVPLATPAEARIVSEPRVFADRETGAVDGLWSGGGHGDGTQSSSATRACHDITSYPAIGLAAGACSGNGILLDISDPANPVRIHEVVDPNFAYWHSATFNNDGTKILFTDEWGGGGAPRCQADDPIDWGANAIFDLVDGRMELAGYYKLPAPQTEFENCVAHNGSLIPVPGRDIKVQAWYQGGVSMFDFTDGANPVEIAFFDRGPLSVTQRIGGGYWSAYWYNGYIYGSEMVRGLDVFRLTPSEHLSQNEIDAANLVRLDEFNPQHQPKFVWPPAFVVSHAFLDQLERNAGLPTARIAHARSELERAERLSAGPQRSTALTELAAALSGDANGAADAYRVHLLVDSVRSLANVGD